jgi:hypothetical protein
MSDFEPVEIRLDLIQNVDSEGEKSTAAINEIAAASNKMKAQFEKDIAAQKTLTTQLINELKLLKETMGKKVETGDDKQIIDKQKLAEQIDLLNKKLIEQEALLNRIGKTAPTTPLPKLANDVGAYARQVNGLKFSMTQITREMPNFAISPMIGIMSLSNNLPMLQGDITRMIELNKQLKASGQSTIPIFKQLASALFSWQTALIAGISAIMLFGPEISKWVSNLFRAKDALRLTRDEVNGLNESFAKAAGADLGKLKTQFDALKNAKKGTVEYYDVKKQIIDQFGGYLKGMDSEIASLNNVKGAYQALTVEIIKSAKAKALQETTSTLATDFLTKSGKSYDAIQANFINEFGENLGKMRFDMFKKQLESGGDFTYEMQRYIAEFTETKLKHETKVENGVFGTYTEKVNINPILDAIEGYKKAKNEFDQKTKDAWDRFGNPSETAIKNTVAVIDERIQALKTEQKQVSDNKEKWDEYQKQIDKLEKDKKAITGAEDDKTKGLEDQIKKVEEKMLKASGKELDFLAAKLVLLNEELELRRQIANAAILKVKDPETEKIVKANQPLVSKGISPIIQKGSTKTVNGILYEVTAIDKTGPIWKKVKAEFSDLKKFEKEQNKKGAKDQEEFYEDNYKKRQRFEEDLLNYSRQFTSELIDQLGLTQKQSKELNGLADTIFNLAKGDYLAAGFSAASALFTAIFSSGKEDSTTKALERTNELLNQQAAILANQDGGIPYFQLAAKQYADYGEAIDLTNQKLQESYIITKDEQAKLLSLPTKPMEYTGTDPLEKAQYKRELDEYNKARKEIDAVNKEISEGMNERKNWSPEQFIAAYSAGSLILDQQQIDWLAEITQKQKERSELLQETFRQAVGFDSSDVSGDIMKGIQDGLKLSENGLGGFAKSFGERIKDALVDNITKALNLKLTDGFMTDFNQSMVDGALSDEERKQLEADYEAAVAESNARYEALKPIFDKYGLNDADRTGSTKGIAQASQDSVDELNGRMTAVQAYIYDIRNINQQSFDFEKESRAYDAAILSQLETIAENTEYCKHLENMDRLLSEIQLKGVKIKT